MIYYQPITYGKKGDYIMSLYTKGQKEALMYPKKGYYDVIEKPRPQPPRVNSPICSKGPKVKRKLKTNLHLFD